MGLTLACHVLAVVCLSLAKYGAQAEMASLEAVRPLDRLMGAYDAFEHVAHQELNLWGYTVGLDGTPGSPQRHLPIKRLRPWVPYVDDGLHQLRLGRRRDALTMLQIAVNKFRPPPTQLALIWLTIGAIHSAESAHEDALAAFEESTTAVASVPAYGTALRAHLPQYAVGTVEAKRGRFSAAIAAHERALFYAPDFVPSMHALAALQLVMGDFQGAAHYLRAACGTIESVMGVQGARRGHCVAATRAVDQEASGNDADNASGLSALEQRRRRTVKERGRKLSGKPKRVARRRRGAHLGSVARESRTAEESAALDSMPRIQAHALSALRAPPVLEPVPAPPSGDTTVQANLWRNATSFREAAAAFLRALPVLSRTGDLWALHMNLGRALQEAGAFEEGMRHLSIAAELAPAGDAEWIRLYTALAMPIVFRSVDDVQQRKAGMAARVSALLSQQQGRTHQADPTMLRELYASTHLLPYTGLPHRHLAADVAELFARTAHHNLGRVAGHLQRRSRGDRALLGPPARPSRATADAFVRAAGQVRAAARGEGARIRVGLLSYQLVDGPTGHLVRRLLHVLNGYEAGAAKAAEKILGTSAHGPDTMGQRAAETLTRRFARLAEPAEAVARQQAWGGGSSGITSAPPAVLAGGAVLARPAAQLRTGHDEVVVHGVAAFEPVLVLARPTGDVVTRWCREAVPDSRVVRLWQAPNDRARLSQPASGYRGRNLTLAQDALASADLDVLVVLDNAIDPFVAALLQSRVAPVQVAVLGAGSGHFQTQGLPHSIDFLVIGDGEAAAAAQDHVAEQLVRLGDVGTFFAPIAAVTRAEMFNASAVHSLFANHNYYVVPRMLLALHPAMDELLAAILKADPQAVVVAVFEPLQLLWLERVRARLIATLGNAASRVRFVARMHRRGLWALMTAASVVLDTFPVGMGVLAVEAAFIGAPVVTLEQAQPVRRPAAAVARRLGLEESLVAHNVSHAAALAVAIATDMPLRFHLRSALLQRAESLIWPDDPHLPPLQQPDPGSLTPGDEPVFAAVEATDAQFAEAGLMTSAALRAKLASRRLAEFDGEGTLTDWLRFLGRVGRRAAAARREHLSETVPVGALLGVAGAQW